MLTQRQQLSTLTRGEEAEEANAHEASGQHVLQESAKELFARQRHQPLLGAVGVVFPAESDFAVDERDQAVIGDRDAVGVRRQVVEHVTRPAEGRFGVNDPVLLMERAYERAKCLLLSQTFQRAGQAELAVAIGVFESIDKLAAKDDAECFDRQKEAIARRDPSRVIGRETARRNYAVNVRMVDQVLAPGSTLRKPI